MASSSGSSAATFVSPIMWFLAAFLLTATINGVRSEENAELPGQTGSADYDIVVEMGEEKVLDILAAISVVREEIVAMNNRHTGEMREIKKLLKQQEKACSSACIPSKPVVMETPKTTEASPVIPSTLVLSQELTANKPRRHCSDLMRYHNVKISGVYEVMLPSGDPLDVFCDMTTDTGGWTLLQRRVSGNFNFSRNWQEYREGFGSLVDEFWLGNEFIHLLTQRGDPMELRVDLWGCDNRKAYEIYRTFQVRSEVDGYRLIVDSPYGTAGRALDSQNGTKFSTWDRDNDHLPSHNCAQYYNGFWYFACGFARLNGRHHMLECQNKPDGIVWFPWNKRKSRFYSARKVEMKIRPRQFYYI